MQWSLLLGRKFGLDLCPVLKVNGSLEESRHDFRMEWQIAVW